MVRGEEHLCLNCREGMPKTSFHLQPNNLMEQRLWGKVPIVRATALYYYQKGSDYQRLIHLLKYKNHRKIGIYLGFLGGIELLESKDFLSVDMIVPVPLHPLKAYKRGYNQSEMIAVGLSKALGKPLVRGVLVRKSNRKSQTKKSFYERYENIKNSFRVKNPNLLAGQHILLVDDVLTTGSTIESCVCELVAINGVRVSIFTLGVAI